MRVVIERDEPRRSVKVYVLRESDVKTFVLQYHGADLATWEELTNGDRLKPTFVMDENVFVALVREGMQVVPESAVMERAWVDAMTVRDRALSLVERLVP